MRPTRVRPGRRVACCRRGPQNRSHSARSAAVRVALFDHQFEVGLGAFVSSWDDEVGNYDILLRFLSKAFTNHHHPLLQVLG